MVQCDFCGKETEWLNTDQVAQLLGVPQATIRRWIREGKLEHEKVWFLGKYWYRIREDYIIALLRSGTDLR